MSWSKHGLVSCGMVLPLLIDAASTRAGEPIAAPFNLGVSYQAPAGCPGASTFMSLLAQHLAAEDNAPLHAQVRISEPAPLYRLKLTVDVGFTRLHGEETASSCDELVRLAALMTAMARTQPAPSDPLEPISDVEEPSTTGMPEPSSTDPGPSAPPEPDMPSEAGGPGWLLAGQMQGGLGLLPGVSFGTGPLVELAWRSFALRAAASWWLPQDVVPQGGLDSLATLTLSLQSVDLAACLRRSMYEAALHELALMACGVFSGYRVGTESTQFGGSSEVTYRAGAGLSVGARWALPGELELGAQLGLSDLARPFRVHATPLRGSVYESRGSQMYLELLVGFRFGGGGEG